MFKANVRRKVCSYGYEVLVLSDWSAEPVVIQLAAELSYDGIHMHFF